jgi:hypothetical protein
MRGHAARAHRGGALACHAMLRAAAAPPCTPALHPCRRVRPRGGAGLGRRAAGDAPHRLAGVPVHSDALSRVQPRIPTQGGQFRVVACDGGAKGDAEAREALMRGAAVRACGSPLSALPRRLPLGTHRTGWAAAPPQRRANAYACRPWRAPAPGVALHRQPRAVTRWLAASAPHAAAASTFSVVRRAAHTSGAPAGRRGMYR